MVKTPSRHRRIAIFASGNGTNAEAIMRHFEGHDLITVSLVVTNRDDAGVIARAEKMGVEWAYLPKADLTDEELVIGILEEYRIDWIVLAGWLLLIPPFLIKAYPNRILNIHPALLPKFGGKGMYGRNVHQAVKDSGASETGITVHLVNERYDEGRIIAQHKVAVGSDDSVADIESKVRKLELEFFPKEIEKLLLSSK